MARFQWLVVIAAAGFALSLPGQASTTRVGLIAFERDYSIYVVNPDGTGLRLLAKKWGREPGEGDGYLKHPAFTPDGSGLTYVNGIRVTHQSVSVRPSTGGPPKLHRIDGMLLFSALSFSPDGRLAVVTRALEDGFNRALFIGSTTRKSANLLGTQITGDPLPLRPTRDQDPDWSPDGRTIVFSRQSGKRPARLTTLGWRTRVVRQLVVGWEPDWAPTEQLIAFVRSDGVYTCRLDGTAVRRLVRAAGAVSPDFSPDGKGLAYVASGSVWVVPVNGGSPSRIAGEATGNLDWG